MYKTPRACYKKAPVRRETEREALRRQMLQVPCSDYWRMLVGQYEKGRAVKFTVNKDLVPGEAKYIKEVNRV